MSHRYTTRFLMALMCVISQALHSHSIILEVKGSYFLPTNPTFQKIFQAGATFGPEATVRLYKQLYGFVSADFYNKDGAPLGLDSLKKVNVTNIGAGLKYFIPFYRGSLYAGLGILPTKLQLKDCAPNSPESQTTWGCGGIAKVGTYLYLPAGITLNLFFDYSFETIRWKNATDPLFAPLPSAHLSGYWFGAAIGLGFN